MKTNNKAPNVEPHPLEQQVKRVVAAQGLDNTHTKYPCYNSERCTATWTWDDWHCCGCKHQGLQQGDLIPNNQLEINHEI
jgi:hypothetical protein